MSYRSDHDAALARVDALEHELAQLKKGAPPPSKRTHRWAWLVALSVALGAVVALASIALLTSVDAGAARTPTASRAELEACAEKLPPKLEHGKNVDGIDMQSSCRAQLRSYLETGLLDDHEYGAARRWLDAEDELANVVSMIAVYYSSTTSDDGKTAPQLWAEYDRAYDARNRAIASWR